MSVVSGTVALKMRYLGGVFVGQDLCRCRIEVGENAVYVNVTRAGVTRHTLFVDTPSDVLVLKSKLRNYLGKMKIHGRWKWTKIRPGNVYIEIYYPSRSWLANSGRCRLFCSTDTF